MDQIFVFHLAYYNESAQNWRQSVEMRHSQHAKSTEHVIDAMDTHYDGALAQAKREYRRKNPCSVFGDSRPIRVIHWENA